MEGGTGKTPGEDEGSHKSGYYLQAKGLNRLPTNHQKPEAAEKDTENVALPTP